MSTLKEYIHTWKKDGLSFEITNKGTIDFLQARDKDMNEVIVGTDYYKDAADVSPAVALSFITRPDTESLVIHRVISDEAKGQAFQEKYLHVYNDLMVKAGWSYSFEEKDFDQATMSDYPFLLLI